MVTLADEGYDENAWLRARLAALEDALETTSRERDNLRGAMLQMPAMITLIRSEDQAFTLANKPWMDSAIGNSGREVLGIPIRQVFPELVGQGIFEMLDSVCKEGKAFGGDALPVDLVRTDNGELDRRYYAFHYLPHRGPDDEVLGVITHAADVTAEFIAREQVQKLNTKLGTFLALAENAPDGISVTVDGKIMYANASFRSMLGEGEACVGRPHAELVAEESRAVLQEAEATATPDEPWRGMLTYRRSDDSTFIGQASTFAIHEETGGIRAVGTILRDLTEQHRSEEERDALREQVLAAHQRVIRELSTPLIPLAEGLVVMPLLGTIDSSRAKQIMETLLEGIATQRARTAILDVTGIKYVDTAVANALIKTAQAASLLGTEVVLTGIGPHVARILVELGVDLGTLKTRGTLQNAVACALKKPTQGAATPALKGR
ncbi:PAS domain-containing protein [Chondromyces apiculatus]|uniref:Putative PAS/PAC sensor protein n=1 Tax=Chondromyces apiculatus DSM 436 TaxID=1192034 RepID=A0A017TBB2_9BACT|nr:PAS domain-containing protein [Chondromyces apiculatus]EYF06100.1 putative PAS/PAC sensor protein [Chondromyces apiculatus DSM 436]